MRKYTVFAALAALSASACAEAPGGPEQAAYLTLMGNDTLAIEWVEFDGNSVTAQALIRGSRTTFGEYHLSLSETGDLAEYSGRVYAGGDASGEVLRSEELVRSEAGAQMVTTRGGQEQSNDFEAAPGAVPFVDMLHWPFETALRWQAGQGGFADAVQTFSGRGMSFELIPNEDGSWGIRHPSRGVSTMTVDDEGRILTLDGTGSTRAYDLTRVEYTSLDKAAMAAAFADRPLGELSGRGEVTDFVAGVQFNGDYGAPVRRGRDIFGGLLSYGVWWRTGANAATQFGFDRDITIDGTVIPAGFYSLSSIPEEDGGTLIINRRTGQGGQSYDEAEDQARVTLRRDTLDERVEVFEIRVVPEGSNGGRIELRWDNVVYWVPFTAG